MSELDDTVSWVVYKMMLYGKDSRANAVCSQSEWNEMERQRPGYHTLVRSRIPTEGEAEILARGPGPSRPAVSFRNAWMEHRGDRTPPQPPARREGVVSDPDPRPGEV